MIVYTALIADEDLPLEQVGKFFPFTHDKNGVEYVAFTNRKDLTSDFWDVRHIELRHSSPRMDARYYKLNPHILFPDHDVSIWMDSQCYFTYDPKDIVNHFLTKQGADIAIHHHSDMDGLHHEAFGQAFMYKNDNAKIVMRQFMDYLEEDFPVEKYDHFETGILLRKNTKVTEMFNTWWWEEIKTKSLRDQLSCPYVVWKIRKDHPNAVYTIPESFTAHKHHLPTPKSQIFFTTPKPPLREDISKRKEH
jgi:hypothetical protein